MPRVSVVIPVYNTEPCLARCLDSVRGQTLGDIEILCVDDASTDGSLAVLREYAAKDSRIAVIAFSRNMGVSAARNAAVAAARGEYLGFVDSDDAIEPDFYEKLYAKARETGAPIVKGVRRQTAEDGAVTDDPLNDKVRQNKSAFTFQWTTAVYRTDFIRDNGIACPPGVRNGEDTAFLLKAVCAAPSVETVDDAVYHYLRRPDSATGAASGYSRVLSALDAYKDVLVWLNEHADALPADDYAGAYAAGILFCRSLARKAVSGGIQYTIVCARTALTFYSLREHKDHVDARLAGKNQKFHDLLVSGDLGGLIGLFAPGEKTAPATSRIRNEARLAAPAKNKEERPKVSVVIPVYNTGLYLRRCLDSVCGQTLRGIEIFCVNDASPDDALATLRGYAAKDSRITVIDFSRNLGVSAARNAAIAVARGEYLGFVDSDDAIAPDFYEKLHAKTRETGSFIVKGVLRWITEEGAELGDHPLNGKIRLDKLAFASQWTTAIYRTAFIRDNGIACPLGVTNGQDSAFLAKAVSLAPSVEIVDDAEYRYFRRPGSAASETLATKNLRMVFQALEDAVSFLSRRMIPRQEYDAMFWRRLLHCPALVRRRAHPEDERAFSACAESMLRMWASYRHQACPPQEHALLRLCLALGDVDTLAGFLRNPPKTKKQKDAAHVRFGLRLRRRAGEKRSDDA